MSFLPEKNKVYYLRNQHSQRVAGVEGGPNNTQNGKRLLQWLPAGAADHKWLIFSLDGGLYAIVSRNSGYVIAIEGGHPKNTQNGANIFQWYWSNADDQKWSFTSSSNAYNIVSHKSGRVIGVWGGSNNTKNGQPLILWDAGAGDRRWTFEAIETINLPATPAKGTLPDIPHFTSTGQNLPDRTDQILTAFSDFPCIMVNDTWGPIQKIKETPYYRIMKREYWEKVFQEDIAAHDSIKKKEIFGMRTVEQRTMEEKTAITVAADAGFAFKGVSASLSTTVAHELSVTHSTTTEVMRQFEAEYEYNNPTAVNVSYGKYRRVVEYRLLRANGTEVSPPWTVKKDSDTRITTWPDNTPIGARETSRVPVS
jgi:hypothetical protein